MGAFTHDHDPDQELITRSQRGDQGAFRALLETHHRFAYAIAFRLVRDEDEACDIVQDAFVRVWKNLPAYRRGNKFTTWLYKIVVNLCYDRIRMNKRRQKVFLPDTLSEEEPSRDMSPHRAAELSDYQSHILAAAESLPPMQRIVFQLRDLQDLTIAEICRIVGVSAGSVKTNLWHARKRIRETVLGLEEQRT